MIVVFPTFILNRSGWARVLVELGNGLIKRGHTVYFLAPKNSCNVTFPLNAQLVEASRVFGSIDREYVREELVELLEKAGFSKKHTSFPLAYDKITVIQGQNGVTTHVLKGWIFHRIIINASRAFLFPLKLLIPRSRSNVLLIGYKEEI